MHKVYWMEHKSFLREHEEYIFWRTRNFRKKRNSNLVNRGQLFFRYFRDFRVRKKI